MQEDDIVVDTNELLKTAMIDEDEIKHIKKESKLNGTFTTVPPLTVKVEPVEPGVVLVKFQADVVNEKDKGRTFFSIVNKNIPNTFDGKPSLKSQLYTQGRDAYAKAYGSKPTQMSDLVDYIRDYPTTLRINNGFVVNLRAVSL